MNKSQLIEAVAKEANIKKKDAETTVNAVMNVIENTLISGEKVQLVGFGTFDVKERAERQGRNPQTGESITIPASKYPTFTAGKSIKESLNK